MLELNIDSIRVSPMNYQRVVILKDKESDRYLPIWIGPAEADAIAVKLQDLSVPRPLTHDLLLTMLDALGGAIKHILVSDLENDTFYAKIVIDVSGEVKEVDSRPSDAIALAVRTQVAIYANEEVMEKAEWGHSAFTKNLLSGLKQKRADLNSDGTINILDVVNTMNIILNIVIIIGLLF